jgi:xylose isomerase
VNKLPKTVTVQKRTEPKQIITLGRLMPGQEIQTMIEGLEKVDPGDLVVYHKGPTGSAQTSVKRAAMMLCDRNLCLLVQRYTGEETEGGERIVEYSMVKRAGN